MESSMSKTNGQWLRRKLTLTLESWRHFVNQGWTKLVELPWGELLLYGLMLTGLVLALQGCTALSTASDITPRNPEPPPTTLSESSQTYSEAARLNIEAWQKKLTELLPK